VTAREEARQAGADVAGALTSAEHGIHTAMANALSRLDAGTLTPLQARKNVRLESATSLGNASRRIRAVHAKAALSLGGEDAVLPSAPGQVDAAVLTAQHDADVAFRAILGAYGGTSLLPGSSRWRKVTDRAVTQARGEGRQAAVLALRAVAAAGFAGYITPAGKRQELASYGQRVTRAAVTALARMPVSGVIEARREALLARHTGAVALAWGRASARVDPKAVAGAYQGDPLLWSASSNPDTMKAWRQQAAKSAALGAMNSVYQSPAYPALVAALETMIGEGMAEGEADALAIAAAVQQLGPFNLGAAFAAALASLKDDTGTGSRAQAAAAGLITAMGNALARVLGSHGPDGDGLDDDARDVLAGGKTLARAVDWSLWGAFGAGAVALFKRIAGSSEDAGQVLLDWTTDISPCALCQSNADGNPYTPDDLPGYPGHSNCRCSVDPASDVPVSFLAAYLG
jgi:hypothetical protein